jgi:hypothetical protein
VNVVENLAERKSGKRLLYQLLRVAVGVTLLTSFAQ